MNIYLSAGPSTIAALMAVDRAGGASAGRDAVTTVEGGGDARPIARRCEQAVVTAYRDLRQHGTAETAALQACSELYRSHHPEASVAEACLLVEGWIAYRCRKG